MVNNDNLRSIELETQLLAYLIKWPEGIYDITPHITRRDFTLKVHKACFEVIQKMEDKQAVDTTLLIEAITACGVDFSLELEGMSVADYIEALAMRMVKKGVIKELGRQLAIKTFTRDKYRSIVVLANELKSGKHTSIDDIINVCDQHLFDSRDYWTGQIAEPEDLMGEMESVLEERAAAPKQRFLEGPHKKLQKLYGSLTRPQNISCITARSGNYKTSFWMHYGVHISESYGIPWLHLDNGEMDKHSLMCRIAASLSGVPLYLIENDLWRYNKDTEKRVRDIWPRTKKSQFLYYNVAGHSTEQLLSVIQRFYFKKIGRGELNKMVCCFDYIKAGIERGNKPEYLLINDFMVKMKNFVSRNCPISIVTSVQANRMGVTAGKKASEVIDSEEVVGLADAIQHNVSHMFILRKKTLDEVAAENRTQGNYKLVNIKARYLGEEAEEAVSWVKFPNGEYKQMWVNFDIANFNIREVGTAKTSAKYLEGKLDSGGKGEEVNI